MKCTQIRTWVIYVGCIISLNENVPVISVESQHFHNMNSIFLFFFFRFHFILQIYYSVVSRLFFAYTFIVRLLLWWWRRLTSTHSETACCWIWYIVRRVGFQCRQASSKEFWKKMQFYYVLEKVVHRVRPAALEDVIVFICKINKY